MKRTPSAARHASSRGAPQWAINWAAVLAAVIALLGLGVFMYPSTAAWWSQYHQSQAIQHYTSVVSADPPPGNVERLAEAYTYNDLLNSGDLVLGADERKPTTDGAGGQGLVYEDVLRSDNGLMARLKIPAIDVDLPVYHGTSDEVLNQGVGHLEGTSLPVGGMDTHSALTAHTGLATATLFNDLNKLRADDTFTIEVAGDVLTYRVFDTQVVEPSESRRLAPRPGEDLVTLVTCTPLGINSHRILVTGERITPTPEADIVSAGTVPEIPGFPWWAVTLPGGVLGAAAFVWRTGYSVQPTPTK